MKWWGSFLMIVGIGTGLLPKIGLNFRPAELLGEYSILLHIGLAVLGLIFLSVGYFKPQE